MPRILIDVIGSVLIAVSAISARMRFARLRSRRASRVISAPEGFPVRLALLTAAVGLWLLIGGWAVVGVMWAIIVWELAVQATAWVRRTRRARESRAS